MYLQYLHSFISLKKNYFIFLRVSSIEAEFFDHRSDGVPFFEGWEATLKAFFRPIPTISDGGYTRGHFFEFENGHVSIRQTITSGLLYEHNYVESGGVGVIRESMIKKFFGNTPFGSATLDDIILPRHRPRVWDETKMTNFSGNLTPFHLNFGHTIRILLSRKLMVKWPCCGTHRRKEDDRHKS